MSAALIGSGVGLSLGAVYMAGGMAHAAADHSRSERIAQAVSQAADGTFSETVLQRQAAGMDPAALRLAHSHDPLTADGREPAQGFGPMFDRVPDLRPSAATGGRFANPLTSARDLDCLTQAVYFEARGETARGQEAVAQVVLNRVHSPAFPKTVCGVVFQRAASHGCQFSFACDGSMRQGREADAWDRARLIAARALSGAVLADVGSATHFHALGVSPGWGPQMLRVAQVGLHVFYRFNPHAPSLDARALRSEPVVEHAVFTSLPMQAVAAPGGLRLATAMAAKAADATVSGLTPAVSPAGEPKPAPLAVSASEKGVDAAAVAPRATTGADAS